MICRLSSFFFATATVFLGLLGTVFCASAQHGEERRYFDDWLASCRPASGYCSATSYVNPNPGNGTVADYVLRVGRAATGQWELSLSTVRDMPETGAEISAVAGDANLRLEAGRDYAAYGSINDFFIIGDAAQYLFDHMAPADQMTFSFQNDMQNPSGATFSLDGLMASLLWIDEQQRRLGSERIAGQPPEGLTPTGTEVAGAGQVAPELAAWHFAQSDCNPFDLVRGAFESFDLPEGNRLHIVPCYEGAYNYSKRLYVERPGATPPYQTLLFVDFWDEGGWVARDLLVNPTFDPVTLTLESFNMGRGIGDCGSLGTWRWNGHDFILQSFRFKAECDATLQPDAFEQLYP